MNNTFVTLIPVAIGVGVSPAPIIELILVLFSKRRVVNSIAFIVTLLLMTALVLVLGALGGQASGGRSPGPSPLVGWLFLVLGALLLAIGIKNWRNRADTSEPAMFATITGLGPAAVAFLAFGAVAVNPKNTVLLLTAGQSIGAASSPWLYGVGFVLLATLPYTLSVGYALLGGEAATARLDRMRAWLVARNRLIMGIICGLLGLVLVLKGVAAVAA
jgi:Sap-like sulfolipid-1-addressing protein